MELRDYLQMLKRRWPAVVLITIVFIGCASLYLVIAPKRYESSTSLLVSATGLRSVNDLQQSATFARQAATTYATIIDSATVLGPVAGDLRPQRDVDDLVGSVTATVPTETTLIVITAAGDRADQAANLANAVAAAAARILPTLAPAADGSPLIQLDQTRPATEPAAAVSPNAKRVLVLGFVVGLCFGIATVIVMHTLDTRIRRVDDLRPITRLPVLAVLPAAKRSRRGGVVGPDDLVGPAGEAFRALRTNLRFLDTAEQRSLVVAAVADHGDGAKVAVNLARSLAQAGRRVLLIDVDLLESPVAELLGVDATKGLADVLTGRADPGRVIRGTKYAGLYVLPSGTPHLGPSDLLSSPILTGVLRRVEKEHDYVILHAPALLRSTDATIVSGATCGTLVTVAAGLTRVQDLQTALGALANARVTPLGVVLSGGRPGDAQRENDAGQPGPVIPLIAAPLTAPPVTPSPPMPVVPPSGPPSGPSSGPPVGAPPAPTGGPSGPPAPKGGPSGPPSGPPFGPVAGPGGPNPAAPPRRRPRPALPVVNPRGGDRGGDRGADRGPEPGPRTQKYTNGSAVRSTSTEGQK